MSRERSSTNSRRRTPFICRSNNTRRTAGIYPNITIQTKASPSYRVNEDQNPNVSLGYHHEWSPGVHTLFFAARLNDTIRSPTPRSLPCLKYFRTIPTVSPPLVRTGHHNERAFCAQVGNLFRRTAADLGDSLHTIPLSARAFSMVILTPPLYRPILYLCIAWLLLIP